jgi:catechol 2,3-dioxygenase-like lactoylglutathione lyase family enzyme
MPQSLTTGFHHVATVTRDMERLIKFYGAVFDASPLFDLVAPGLEVRHVALDLGGSFVHAWEVPEERTGEFPLEMFRRGRLDHMASRRAMRRPSRPSGCDSFGRELAKASTPISGASSVSGSRIPMGWRWRSAVSRLVSRPPK